MARHDREILGAVASHDFVQTRYVCGEFGIFTAGVGEQPAVPVDQAQRGEAELVGLEALHVTESGRVAQPAVQPIRP